MNGVNIPPKIYKTNKKANINKENILNKQTKASLKDVALDDVDTIVNEWLSARQAIQGKREWERLVNEKTFLARDIRLNNGGLLSCHLEVTDLKDQQKYEQSHD